MHRPSNAQPRRLAFLTLAVCAGIFAFFVYRYMAFNLWVERDATRLEPFPRVLVEKKDQVPAAPDPGATPEAIDRALLAENAANRLVVHLSRSDIRYDLLHRRAFVKVFLETSLPGQPDRIQRIKILNVLEKRNGEWVVVRTEELTIP